MSQQLSISTPNRHSSGQSRLALRFFATASLVVFVLEGPLSASEGELHSPKKNARETARRKPLDDVMVILPLLLAGPWAQGTGDLGSSHLARLLCGVPIPPQGTLPIRSCL